MSRAIKFPKLLYSYLATEMLAPFFASFLIMNAVFFLIKLIPFLNIVLELEIGLADFIRMFLYLFPNMFLYSMPMAAMLGVIIGFTRLSSDTEILAFKASGLSIYQLIPPVILVSAAIACITGYFSIVLIPKADSSMKQLMFQVAKEKIDKGIKEHQFTEALGDLVVYVDSINKKTGEWQDVWVSDMRGQKDPIITMAKYGSMTADINTMVVTIVLRQGSLHRPDNNRSQIIAFRRYTIDIPLQPPTVLHGEDATKISPSAMTMSQLQQSATAVGRDTEKGKERLIHYHKRIVLPFGCFILSLLGLPLGLRAGPGKRGAGVPLGLAFFVLYYIMFTMATVFAEGPAMPVFVAMWIPNVVFTLIVAYFIRQAANELPVIPIGITNFFAAIIDKWLLIPLQKIRGIFRKNEEQLVQSVTLHPTTEASSNATVEQEKVEFDSSFLTEGTVHGNVNSHVFHVQGCEFYYCQNCTVEFQSVAIARHSGFEACRFCKKLLDDTV